MSVSQHNFGLAQTNLYEMRSGHTKLSLGGGIQVFLDMEHAFDAVPRSLLAIALKRQPLHPDLIHLLECWYSSTAYHYQHHGHDIEIDATTGVRQGCVAAPMLWNCHTCNVMMELQVALGDRWVQDVLTLFADDFHVQWSVMDEHDFEQACQQLSLFLMMLARLQVQVRAERSSLMMLLGGRSYRSLVEKRLCRRDGHKYFKVHKPKTAEQYGQVLFPIVRTQK